MALLFVFGCKEAYVPSVFKSNKNYLVVEGTIVSGADSTVIHLSKTANIADTLLPQPVSGATVAVQGEDNTLFPLADRGDGSYFTDGLNLDVNKKYKLVIHAGSNYESDFVPVKQTPPIDSIGWNQDDENNVRINVSTHAPSNNSRYYRWDYIETWQYSASYATYADWVNRQLVQRPFDQLIYYCWSSKASSTIQTATSAKLAQDVILKAPVAIVNYGSEKISKKYSILLKQYSLTKDAYDFWELVKSSTQQLGSLFDAQPAQLKSNIHNISDTSEKVIGYVSASSVQTKRIFIDKQDIIWVYMPYYLDFDCKLKVVAPQDMDTYIPPSGPAYWVAVGQQPFSPNIVIIPAECADCRLHGGTNIKPAFWQ